MDHQELGLLGLFTTSSLGFLSSRRR